MYIVPIFNANLDSDNGAENLLRLIADRIEAQGGEPFHG